MDLFRIHGGNIVECERIADIIIRETHGQFYDTGHIKRRRKVQKLRSKIREKGSKHKAGSDRDLPCAFQNYPRVGRRVGKAGFPAGAHSAGKAA